MAAKYSVLMIIQLEYHLLRFSKNIFYYVGITLNVFSDLLCSKLCWHNRLVPTDSFYVDCRLKSSMKDEQKHCDAVVL